MQASADGKALGAGYLFPLSKETDEVFEERWRCCIEEEGCGPPTPTTIPILFGRTLLVSWPSNFFWPHLNPKQKL